MDVSKQLHLRDTLIELRKQQEDTEAAIRTIERLMGLDNPSGLPPLTEGSIAERIRTLLDNQPHRTFSVPELMDRLGKPNHATLRGVLAALVREGKILRPMRGLYQSLESYHIKES